MTKKKKNSNLATILCIETSTTNCSVALGINGVLQHLKEDREHSYSHSEKLHIFIEELMSEAQLSLNDLDAIAISKGPGSYTGLRIGVSAAKGLCYALDKPLIAIDTLESLAQQVSAASFIIPMLDARRMEVYSAIYNAQKQILRNTQAQILDNQAFLEQLNIGNVAFVGNAVGKFKTLCQHPNAQFIDTVPSAKDLVVLANEKYKIKTFEDVAYFEPFYLKDFVAGKKAKS